MLTSVIASIGVPVLTQIVAEALGKLDNNVAKKASEILKEVDLNIQSGAISSREVEKANAHILSLKKLESDDYKEAIRQVNETYRAEIASHDIYIRRMRPTFGYIMAVSWGAQMLAVAYIMVFYPHLSGTVMNALSSISGIWAVGLSVLGIYVYKRSEEKKNSPLIRGQGDIMKKIIENIKE